MPALLIAMLFLTLIVAIIYLQRVNDFIRDEYEKERLIFIKDIETLKREHANSVTLARADTLKRSRSTMRGQATEHLAPLVMKDFNTKDFRFLGTPIDYLVCRYASDHIDGIEEHPIIIYLLDIKTGVSQLSKIQRKIKEAIIAGRVFFATYNPDTGEFREWTMKNEEVDGN